MAMVTRFTVNNKAGLMLTADETFSDDTAEAIQFRHEDEAVEVSALYAGTTVERFQIWRKFPDFVSALKAELEHAA